MQLFVWVLPAPMYPIILYSLCTPGTRYYVQVVRGCVLGVLTSKHVMPVVPGRSSIEPPNMGGQLVC